MAKAQLVDHVLIEHSADSNDPAKLPGLGKNVRAWWECETCGQTWKESPASKCPGAKVYSWDPWPKDLFTRKQLAAKKLNPGPLAGVIPYSKSADGDGWLRLYRMDEATPKPELSEKRKAALAKAQAAAEAARHCPQCGAYLYNRYSVLCEQCEFKIQTESAQLGAAREAYDLICSGDFVVWDSETTDLGGRFIDLAVIDAYGKVLFESRVRPGCFITPGAYDVHGIPDETLISAPAFLDIYADLRRVLHGQHWVIYNSEFDTGILYNETHYTDHRYYYAYQPIEFRDVTCAMHLYAAFYGDWHNYYGNYRWQKLDSAVSRFGIDVSAPAHSALGDCLRTLEVLYSMADWYRNEVL